MGPHKRKRNPANQQQSSGLAPSATNVAPAVPFSSFSFPPTPMPASDTFNQPNVAPNSPTLQQFPSRVQHGNIMNDQMAHQILEAVKAQTEAQSFQQGQRSLEGRYIMEQVQRTNDMCHATREGIVAQVNDMKEAHEAYTTAMKQELVPMIKASMQEQLVPISRALQELVPIKENLQELVLIKEKLQELTPIKEYLKSTGEFGGMTANYQQVLNTTVDERLQDNNKDLKLVIKTTVDAKQMLAQETDVLIGKANDQQKKIDSRMDTPEKKVDSIGAEIHRLIAKHDEAFQKTSREKMHVVDARGAKLDSTELTELKATPTKRAIHEGLSGKTFLITVKVVSIDDQTGIVTDTHTPNDAFRMQAQHSQKVATMVKNVDQTHGVSICKQPGLEHPPKIFQLDRIQIVANELYYEASTIGDNREWNRWLADTAVINTTSFRIDLVFDIERPVPEDQIDMGKTRSRSAGEDGWSSSDSGAKKQKMDASEASAPEQGRNEVFRSSRFYARTG